jgi:hypothetical protein
MVMRSMLVALGLGCFAGACSDAGTQSPASTAGKERCGKTKAQCGVSCAGDTAKMGTSVRQSYWDATAACSTSLACGTNIPVVQDCLAQRAACSGGFPDDLCHSLAALTDDARQTADGCRSRPCADSGTCLRAAGAFSF